MNEFKGCKVAELKSGGSYAYLSRSDEVNVFIQIHLMHAIELEEERELEEEKKRKEKAEQQANHS